LTGTTISPLKTPLIAVFWLIFAYTGLKLIVSGLAPLHPDEAYYWLWSQHLSLGYYDHPPMVAYWIKAGTAIFGENPLGVRFLFCLSFCRSAH